MIYTLLFVSSLIFARDFPVELREQVGIYHYSLDNGLDLYVTKNPKAPVVSIFHWVRAGSLNEKKGITGIAHLFEHMMFRPVHKGEKGFFDKITALGGSANANTRYMATVYTTSVPANNLEGLLKIESDRFMNLKVTDELLDVERKAVWSEYSTKFDTNPVIDIWGKIYEAGFPGHPYEWTVIGYRQDLEKIKAKDCNAFFDRYYRPNNTGLFISGDIEPSKVYALVKKYYAGWKRGEDSSLPKEFQKNTKFTSVTGRIPSPSKQVLLGFRTKDEDKHSLEYMFINHLLFGSSHSLSDRRIKQNAKLASAVSDFNYDYDSGLVKGFFVLLPKATLSKLTAEVLKLKSDIEAMDEKNFSAYKQEFITSLLEGTLRNDSLNEAIALSWGKYKDLNIFLDWDEKVRALKKESIVNLLNKFYNKDNMIVVTTKAKE
ncbi:MAG: insulinase family protein [Bdellovibrionales bacterium]|nr:insulinase family protein [Bdellovibrionales bacterium]